MNNPELVSSESQEVEQRPSLFSLAERSLRLSWLVNRASHLKEGNYINESRNEAAEISWTNEGIIHVTTWEDRTEGVTTETSLEIRALHIKATQIETVEGIIDGPTLSYDTEKLPSENKKEWKNISRAVSLAKRLQTHSA